MEFTMDQATQTQAKKGLPTIAWIAIGCGALIVVMVVVLTVGGLFMASKVKEVAGDFEDNPGLAAARMIVKLNPDLEEVSSDEEAGTITVRNKKSGEEVTVNFEDIEEGRLSFSTGDREVTIDTDGEGDSGSIKVSDDKGSFVLSSGDEVAEEIPSWVPVYPGSEPTSRHTMHSQDAVSGGFEIATTDSVSDVLEYYRSELKEQGFEVNVNTFSQEEGSSGGMVNGRDESEGRNVVVILNSEDEGSKVVVSYNQGS